MTPEESLLGLKESFYLLAIILFPEFYLGAPHKDIRTGFVLFSYLPHSSVRCSVQPFWFGTQQKP